VVLCACIDLDTHDHLLVDCTSNGYTSDCQRHGVNESGAR
jgi:hypothetical protein